MSSLGEKSGTVKDAEAANSQYSKNRCRTTFEGQNRKGKQKWNKCAFHSGHGLACRRSGKCGKK